MLIDGQIMSDGMDVLRYLDKQITDAVDRDLTPTGIIIGSIVRPELTKACQHAMGMKTRKAEETVNRFMDVLLIEDGENPERLELVCGPKISVTPPVDGNRFAGFGKLKGGLKRYGT